MLQCYAAWFMSILSGTNKPLTVFACQPVRNCGLGHMHNKEICWGWLRQYVQSSHLWFQSTQPAYDIYHPVSLDRYSIGFIGPAHHWAARNHTVTCTEFWTRRPWHFCKILRRQMADHNNQKTLTKQASIPKIQCHALLTISLTTWPKW